ncbi:MAG: HNH endonuclease signature motif containing protein [Acidimicrobiia bacterium]
MFNSAGTDFTIDELEHHLLESVSLLSKVTARMLPAIRALDAGQVAHLDGARGMDEWLAARLDLDVRTARQLLGLARANDRRVDAVLESGQSVDRADAIRGLIQHGADQDTLDAASGRDIAGVRQMTASHRQITSDDEADSFDSRCLYMQPSLDESFYRFWGQLAGVDGRIVEKALQIAADAFPNNPNTTGGQDRADALVAVASEWLNGEVGGHDLAAEIFVDAELATVSNGEGGGTVVTGPRIGPNTLGEILCSGTVRINFEDRFGNVSTSPRSRAIPRAIRNRVLQRDGHRCVVAGCQSRTRLQPHHLVPFSQGGTHHPENLVTVCWYHHHVVIHQQGRQIDPDSPPQRRTFLRTDPTRAGP